MKYKIVLVEDDSIVASAIQSLLKRANYNSIVVETGKLGLEIIKETLPDLVLLDLPLPDFDGMEICKMLKQDTRFQSIPIFIVSARAGEDDILAGLANGADDYITKPFGNKIFLARINALLRRINYKGCLEEVYDFGDLFVNVSKHEVKLREKTIKLSKKEFELLCFLVRKREYVVAKDKLIENVWFDNEDISTKNLDMHISNIRKKMGIYSKEMIKTVRGVGYIFSVEES